MEVTEEPVEANEITTGTIKVGDLTISNEGIKYESTNDEAPQTIERQTPFGVEVCGSYRKAHRVERCLSIAAKKVAVLY